MNLPEPGIAIDQERGLGVEDLRVHSSGRTRCLYASVLTASLLAYFVADSWSEPTVTLLPDLGGSSYALAANPTR